MWDIEKVSIISIIIVSGGYLFLTQREIEKDIFEIEKSISSYASFKKNINSCELKVSDLDDRVIELEKDNDLINRTCLVTCDQLKVETLKILMSTKR
jgi:septal ring factor EnvC (AmiA/AmiB activator)